jgi:hypothetical protein
VRRAFFFFLFLLFTICKSGFIYAKLTARTHGHLICILIQTLGGLRHHTKSDLSRAETLNVFMHPSHQPESISLFGRLARAHLASNVAAAPRLIPSQSSPHMAIAVYPVSASPYAACLETTFYECTYSM